MDIAFSLIRIFVPLSVAAKGELIGERAGVLNLGIEGNMLLGAFIGWFITAYTGSSLNGFLAAIIAGFVIGAIFWFFIDILEFNPHVTGLGIGFFSSGLALTLFRLSPSEMKESSLQYSTGSENLILLGIALVVVISLISLDVFSQKHRLGLIWNVIGQDLRSADLLGIEIRSFRLICCIIGSSLALFSGSILSILVARNFTIGIVSGRGWVALCLVILAQWRPKFLILAVIFWAGLEISQFYLQAQGVNVPYQILLMLPYVGCIIVIVGLGSNKRAPAMLVKTYRRNEDAT